MKEQKVLREKNKIEIKEEINRSKAQKERKTNIPHPCPNQPLSPEESGLPWHESC